MGFFLLLFKLISSPIHWIVCVLAYLNFIFEFLSSFSAAQNQPALPRHIKVRVSFELFGALYMYISGPNSTGQSFDKKYGSIFEKLITKENLPNF